MSATTVQSRVQTRLRQIGETAVDVQASSDWDKRRERPTTEFWVAIELA